MWFAVLPWAGACAPSWQVLQELATTTWVWFQPVGFHNGVVTLTGDEVWHVSQFAVPTVEIWKVGFPVAIIPLWHVAHAPVTVTPWLCFQVDGRHVGAVGE
jgi:hypothetical protein